MIALQGFSVVARILRRSRRRLILVSATIFGCLILMAACGQTSNTKPTFGTGGSDTTVDSPKLRELKAEAEIEECPDPVDSSQSQLPNVKLACLGGGTDVVLSQLPVKPTVINIWASYCKPCRDELPILQQAHQDYDDIAFLGIDLTDPNPQAALQLAQNSGVTYPLVADPDAEVRGPLNLVGMPQTIFIDAEGKPVHTHYGAFTSQSQLADAITEHLGASHG